MSLEKELVALDGVLEELHTEDKGFHLLWLDRHICKKVHEIIGRVYENENIDKKIEYLEKALDVLNKYEE